MIWHNKNIRINDLQELGKNTMGEHIGIVLTAIGINYLQGTMPVDNRTKQPYGLLHGGASVTLAETLGSVAAALTVDPTLYNAVGMEINANHIRSARSGIVTGTTIPIHIGATSQVWEIKITDENDKLICVSRLTVAIIKRKS